jgi:hypothetical protein
MNDNATIREVQMSWREVSVCFMMAMIGVIEGEDKEFLRSAAGPLMSAVKNNVSLSEAHDIIRKMKSCFSESDVDVEIIVTIPAEGER